jgi:hypothetical protein
MVEKDLILYEPLNEDVGFFVNLNLSAKSCVSHVLLYLLALTTVIYLLIEHNLFRSSLVGLSLVVLSCLKVF